MEITEMASSVAETKGRRRANSNEISVREVVCGIESRTHTIHTRGTIQERQHSWAYDSNTVFLRCNERIAAEDLLPGDMITILSERRGDLFVARSIRVHLPALHLFAQRLGRMCIQKKAA
jgi:hypothetical protein